MSAEGFERYVTAEKVNKLRGFSWMEKNHQKLHIRHCILHLYHCGVSGAEAARIIREVYGEEEGAVSANACRKWFVRFQAGDFALSDRKRGGRPQEMQDQQLEELLKQNPWQTTHELGQKLGVAGVTVARRLNALGYDLSGRKRKLQD